MVIRLKFHLKNFGSLYLLVRIISSPLTSWLRLSLGVGIIFFYLQAFNLFMHWLEANLRDQNKKQAYATFQAILEMIVSMCEKIESFISYSA